jgi:hypothetical protein
MNFLFVIHASQVSYFSSIVSLLFVCHNQMFLCYLLPAVKQCLEGRRFTSNDCGNMKMTVFWNVAPSSLTEIDQHFRDAYFLHYRGDETNHPDDGGSKHL